MLNFGINSYLANESGNHVYGPGSVQSHNGIQSDAKNQSSPLLDAGKQNRQSNGTDSIELSEKAEENSSSFRSEKELSEEEREQLEELKARDREVRTHEQAHQSAGGSYVQGGATYQYQRGPDGVMYAVGGEVQIDISEVPNSPEATAAKMRTVRQAALAPASPSAQDRNVAALASQKESEARTEANQEDESDNRELSTKSNYSSFGNNEDTYRASTPGSLLEVVA